MWNAFKKELVDTYKFRHVTFNFVMSTLKLRYRRTFLGFIWSLLGPMLHYLIVGIVFSFTMRGTIPNYAAYMFTGALYYNVISGAILKSPVIFLVNEHFIKKVYIPKLVYVLDTVLVELINFFLGFVALLILALLMGKVTFSYHFLFVPYSLVLMVALSVGIASLFAVSGVYFRDLAHIMPVIMQALFFMTPILYETSMMPKRFQFLIELNPIYYFVECFRRPLVFNEWPELRFVAVSSILAFGSLIFGILVLKKFENKIVFRL